MLYTSIFLHVKSFFRSLLYYFVPFFSVIRYYNEANLQLDANHWKLMKQGLLQTPTIPKYIADLAVTKYSQEKTQFVVGIDPFVHAFIVLEDRHDSSRPCPP